MIQKGAPMNWKVCAHIVLLGVALFQSPAVRADPPTGCNMHGCWYNGGGCNMHGCWNSPIGSCTMHGCSEWGVCTMHGCPPGPPRVSMQRPGGNQRRYYIPPRQRPAEPTVMVVPRELPVQPSGLGHFDQQGLSFDYPQSMTLSTKSVQTTLIVTLNNQRSLEAVIMMQRTSDPPSRLHDSMIQEVTRLFTADGSAKLPTSNIVADFNHGPRRGVRLKFNSNGVVQLIDLFTWQKRPGEVLSVSLRYDLADAELAQLNFPFIAQSIE